MKIKAAVVHNKGEKYSIEEVELSKPKANDVLVKIVATGICRSDYGERNGNTVAFPNVLGHEGAGIVEAVGEAVAAVKVGDHVALSYGSCCTCDQCATGRPASCLHWFDINNTGTNKRNEYTLKNKDGDIHNFFNQSSFATYSLVDESNVIIVPKDVDLRMVGPLGCGISTGSGTILNVLKPNPSDSVVIYGLGAVGLSAVMAAKIKGCRTIIAVARTKKRLEMAKEIGATHIIDGNEDRAGIEKKIMEISGGYGVDFSIDTTGVPSIMEQALKVLKNSGSFAPLAVTKDELAINTFMNLVFGNKKIVGVLIGDTVPKLFIPRLLDFYKSGQFPFDKFITYFPFEEINEAEDKLLSGEVIKSVLIMDETYTPA